MTSTIALLTVAILYVPAGVVNRAKRPDIARSSVGDDAALLAVECIALLSDEAARQHVDGVGAIRRLLFQAYAAHRFYVA